MLASFVLKGFFFLFLEVACFESFIVLFMLFVGSETYDFRSINACLLGFKQFVLDFTVFFFNFPKH